MIHVTVPLVETNQGGKLRGESWRFLIHWFSGAVVCFESCESLSVKSCSNWKLASDNRNDVQDLLHVGVLC